MNMIKIVAISQLLFWQAASATLPIPLGSIDVKLEVTAQPRIEIKKPGGARNDWYDNIKLNNSPENLSLFQVEVPVNITLRRQEGFRVSVKNPLILSRVTGAAHQVQPAFSPATVSWGRDHTNLKPLSATPEIFTVEKGAVGQTSTDYLLHISALAPSGQDIAGKYHGQLTLIFETNS
ncbi:fimbrial protein [Yersinia aleksiciae]|uniref:fimbrial protein n=1 Tax=Yersinia aleksiciae TaxID=263819 RepID=UPI0011A84DFF|nr:fimbrial protein [Yersinia aleksiciae]